MTQKTIPTISFEAMELLENFILKPMPAKQGKSHDELLWDECKRHILECIKHNIKVQ